LRRGAEDHAEGRGDRQTGRRGLRERDQRVTQV
jgi:hypothetical protein